MSCRLHLAVLVDLMTGEFSCPCGLVRVPAVDVAAFGRIEAERRAWLRIGAGTA